MTPTDLLATAAFDSLAAGFDAADPVLLRAFANSVLFSETPPDALTRDLAYSVLHLANNPSPSTWEGVRAASRAVERARLL
jgi:hypothetical protein